MNNRIVLELGNDVPGPIIDALPHVEGMRVKRGAKKPLLRSGEQEWRLLVRPRPSEAGGIEPALQALQDQAAAHDELPLVADSVLPGRVRRALERREISYVDGTGALHLVAPGVIVHVERTGPRTGTQEGTGLGAASVRAVQVLLATPQRVWGVRELAAAADLSPGQAHKVLTLLQREGLVETRGLGRSEHRAVREPRLLLDWLAAQRTARRVHAQLACALYTTTFHRLCANVTETLDAKRVAHAWSASAAAALQGAGPTAVPRAIVRVDPERELTEVAELLGATPTDRGANLLLWRDVGRVGIHGAERQVAAEIEVALAPPVRVYLDLLGERRGEDLAVRYREAVIGF